MGQDTDETSATLDKQLTQSKRKHNTIVSHALLSLGKLVLIWSSRGFPRAPEIALKATRDTLETTATMTNTPPPPLLLSVPGSQRPPDPVPGTSTQHPMTGNLSNPCLSTQHSSTQHPSIQRSSTQHPAPSRPHQHHIRNRLRFPSQLYLCLCRMYRNNLDSYTGSCCALRTHTSIYCP